jgi:hypothetical protein
MNEPTIEKISARHCEHVERGELEAASLVRVESLPGHDYRGEPINFNTAACSLCTGRALGAMFAADCELPGDREAVVELGKRLADVLHTGGLEPSHDLALALIEVGWQMARELGKRPK